MLLIILSSTFIFVSIILTLLILFDKNANDNIGGILTTQSAYNTLSSSSKAKKNLFKFTIILIVIWLALLVTLYFLTKNHK